jgi:hypothetical protein
MRVATATVGEPGSTVTASLAERHGVVASTDDETNVSPNVVTLA